MTEEFVEDVLQPESGTERGQDEIPVEISRESAFTRWLETLARLGLGETLLRFGTTGLSLVLVAVVVWALHSFYRPEAIPQRGAQAALAAAPTPTARVELSMLPLPVDWQFYGIARMANIHTTIPSRPRMEIEMYTVQKGDTVFGIAEKFGLSPQTILWGNYYTLFDNPHNLKPGQELIILPINGTYYEWQSGDGLNAVSRFFGVTPEDIINFSGNNLSPETVGDFSRPNIEPGTFLIIPGGVREFVSWSAPIGVTRENAAIARVIGDGACGSISGGAVGFGAFIWPSNRHYLSGFDFSPESNHRGIDLAGQTGEPIYAVDAGVIVYAGWNNYGYGYMVMVDHGQGWQSLYAHMSSYNVGCGQSVGQGDVIGAIGSTGNSTGSHLHFELMHTQYGKVNPWNFLPPP